MKTIKIFLSIVGFALSSICFGQLLSQNNSDLLFYSATYNLASNRLEHRVDPYPARSASGDHFEAPHPSRTFYVPREFDMDIEDWMTKPFESDFYEEVLLLEAWMVSPFESSYYEEDPIIEVWMTKPFEFDKEIEEEIEIEAWMTTIWI
jgi:hypothetical protein